MIRLAGRSSMTLAVGVALLLRFLRDPSARRRNLYLALVGYALTAANIAHGPLDALASDSGFVEHTRNCRATFA